jgi:hypothetical protein
MDWRVRYEEFEDQQQFVGPIIAMENFLAALICEDGE